MPRQASDWPSQVTCALWPGVREVWLVGPPERQFERHGSRRRVGTSPPRERCGQANERCWVQWVRPAWKVMAWGQGQSPSSESRLRQRESEQGRERRRGRVSCLALCRAALSGRLCSSGLGRPGPPGTVFSFPHTGGGSSPSTGTVLVLGRENKRDSSQKSHLTFFEIIFNLQKQNWLFFFFFLHAVLVWWSHVTATFKMQNSSLALHPNSPP